MPSAVSALSCCLHSSMGGDSNGTKWNKTIAIPGGKMDLCGRFVEDSWKMDTKVHDFGGSTSKTLQIKVSVTEEISARRHLQGGIQFGQHQLGLFMVKSWNLIASAEDHPTDSSI